MKQLLMKFWRAKFLSPEDLIRRAVVICILYAVATIVGLREFTTVLNGTAGSIELGWKVSAFLGLLYTILYLAFVLLVPTLLLGVLLLLTWKKAFRNESQTNPPAQDKIPDLAIHCPVTFPHQPQPFQSE